MEKGSIGWKIKDEFGIPKIDTKESMGRKTKKDIEDLVKEVKDVIKRNKNSKVLKELKELRVDIEDLADEFNQWLKEEVFDLDHHELKISNDLETVREDSKNISKDYMKELDIIVEKINESNQALCKAFNKREREKIRKRLEKFQSIGQKTLKKRKKTGKSGATETSIEELVEKFTDEVQLTRFNVLKDDVVELIISKKKILKKSED